MFPRAVAVWVAGLLTLVPYGIYYLLFEAPRDQYALVIVLVLFWVFGYWSVAGPILVVAKVRSVYRTVETAYRRGEGKSKLADALRSKEAEDAIVDMIASENHIPRFVAVKVYRLLAEKLLVRDTRPAS